MEEVKKNTDEKKKTTMKLNQFCANLAVKVNLKSGGANWTLAEKPKHLGGKTMVVGIDVAHPPKGYVEIAPSVAAVVASIDDKFAQWPASIRTQAAAGKKTTAYDKKMRAFERKKQIAAKGTDSLCKECQGPKKGPRKVPQPRNNDTVDDLQNMIFERLELWKTHNKNELPTKILIYRSGLSLAHYTIIPGKELGLIESACKPMYEREHRTQPKISYVVCGNGHHTRFYQTQDGGMNNDYHKLGTVVDRTVTMERRWDFFLAAQGGNLGTAKPARYAVVQDRISIGVDGIEEIVSLHQIRRAKCQNWLRY